LKNIGKLSIKINFFLVFVIEKNFLMKGEKIFWKSMEILKRKKISSLKEKSFTLSLFINHKKKKKFLKIFRNSLLKKKFQ